MFVRFLAVDEGVLADLDAEGASDAAAELAELAAQLSPMDDPEARSRRNLEAAEHHFDAGGELVWLSAGDAVARALYEKIGFRLIATRFNYIDASANG